MESPQILFNNGSIIIINKPANWLSIPARQPQPLDQVLTTWIENTLQAHPFVIHRLDRFTTGVMAFALSEDAHREGNQWFEKRIAKKIYHFFAAPTPPRPAIQIKTPVNDKPAQTLFEVLKDHDSFFYGRATPLTGRFHQVREHAQVAGFPILGDFAYGGKRKDFPRVALHAYELILPVGKFCAPLPADFTDKLGLTLETKQGTDV